MLLVSYIPKKNKVGPMLPSYHKTCEVDQITKKPNGILISSNLKSGSHTFDSFAIFTLSHKEHFGGLCECFREFWFNQQSFLYSYNFNYLAPLTLATLCYTDLKQILNNNEDKYPE